MASAETFILTLDGEKVTQFAPREMLKANQKYALDNPDPVRVFVHVETDRHGSEWRPLELFTRKPALDRIELYAANDKRSKLGRSDPRVVAALRNVGLTSRRLPGTVATPGLPATQRFRSSPAEITAVSRSNEDSARPQAFPDDVRDALLRDGTDEPAIVQRRRDQRRIRQYLLAGADEAPCAVCGSVFPAAFLVAAHILPRAQCTEIQRLDMNNLALMCSLGCDALFEGGMISIQDGAVIGGPALPLGEALTARVATLAGRKAINIPPSAEAYLAMKRALVREP